MTASGNGSEKQAQGLRLLARMIASLHVRQLAGLAPEERSFPRSQSETEIADRKLGEDSQ